MRINVPNMMLFTYKQIKRPGWHRINARINQTKIQLARGQIVIEGPANVVLTSTTDKEDITFWSTPEDGSYFYGDIQTHLREVNIKPNFFHGKSFYVKGKFKHKRTQQQIIDIIEKFGGHGFRWVPWKLDYVIFPNMEYFETIHVWKKEAIEKTEATILTQEDFERELKAIDHAD